MCKNFLRFLYLSSSAPVFLLCVIQKYITKKTDPAAEWGLSLIMYLKNICYCRRNVVTSSSSSINLRVLLLMENVYVATSSSSQKIVS